MTKEKKLGLDGLKKQVSDNKIPSVDEFISNAHSKEQFDADSFSQSTSTNKEKYLFIDRQVKNENSHKLTLNVKKSHLDWIKSHVGGSRQAFIDYAIESKINDLKEHYQQHNKPLSIDDETC